MSAGAQGLLTCSTLVTRRLLGGAAQQPLSQQKDRCSFDPTTKREKEVTLRKERGSDCFYVSLVDVMIMRTRNSLIVATIFVLAAFSFLGVEGCGQDKGGSTCSPPAHFTTSPGTTAVVGQQYYYEVHAVYFCNLLFACSAWHPIQLPPGARVDGRFILWTPTPSQAKKNFQFKIETGRDSCGQTATQSWTVHVSPAAPGPPSVVSVSPSNGASNVPVNSIIRASFNNPVDPQTVTSASFLVSAPSGFIAGTLRTSGSDVTFTPSSNLPYSSVITTTITTAVKDLSGIALASNYSWAFSAEAPPDTTAPSVPTGLFASHISASEVYLAWNNSVDNVAVAGYKLYRDGTYVKSVAGLDAQTLDAGLDFNTLYSYTVSAYDLAGNESPQSASIGIGTLDFLPGNVADWGFALQAYGRGIARTVPDVAMDCNPYCRSLDSVSAISKSGGDLSLAVRWGDLLRWQPMAWPYYDQPYKVLGNVTAVGAGDTHALAIQSNGTVWGWGDNSDGQLGDGTTISATTPVQMLNMSQAAAVTGGFDYSLILKTDGTVWATGGNSLGQLGDGTTNGHTTVIQVPTLSNVIAIDASGSQSLALKSDGTVWAWGGADQSSYHTTPTLVAGISNVIAISQGGGFALAAKADRTVWAWGRNSDGQLGDGTNTDRTVPVQVMGLTNVVAVSAGYYHALALRADGTVWAWGYNYDGQLGDGTTISKNVPVQVLRLTQIKAIAAGWRTSMALK